MAGAGFVAIVTAATEGSLGGSSQDLLWEGELGCLVTWEWWVLWVATLQPPPASPPCPPLPLPGLLGAHSPSTPPFE